MKIGQLQYILIFNRSCLLDLSRFRTSAHGHVEFGGLNRVIMVRKLEERTFNAKNGQVKIHLFIFIPLITQLFYIAIYENAAL